MRVPSSLAVLLGLALIVGACANAAAPSAPPSTEAPPASQVPATDPPAESEAPATDPPESESPAEGYKVGYISLGESIPFVSIVTDGIREEAEKAGVELVVCDSELDAAKALACAQNLRVQEVQAVLNFQLYEDSSAEVCAAYGDLPTIAIDIVQEPCQVAFGVPTTRSRAPSLVGPWARRSRPRTTAPTPPSSRLTPRALGRRPWRAWTA